MLDHVVTLIQTTIPFIAKLAIMAVIIAGGVYPFVKGPGRGVRRNCCLPSLKY